MIYLFIDLTYEMHFDVEKKTKIQKKLFQHGMGLSFEMFWLQIIQLY